MATLDQQMDDPMNADMARAFDDFNLNYLPKYPDLLESTTSAVSAQQIKPADKAVGTSPEPPPEELKANWKAFFDAIFKKGQRYSEVGAVRD